MHTNAEQTQHVAFFAGRDMEKIQFTMKHLACQVSVKPVHVHVFLRTGRDADGRILNRRMVAKLAEVRQYLQQTQHTFESIKAQGSLDFVEVPQNADCEACLDSLRKQLCEADEKAELVVLKDDLCDNPWSLEQ